MALRDRLVFAREMGPPSLDRLIERFGADYPDLAMQLNAAKSSDYQDFFPRWVPRGQLERSHLMAVPQAQFSAGSSVSQRLGNVQVIRWQPPHIELAVKTDIAARIKLHQYYYPGWVARLDGGTTRLEVRPSRPDGLLEVQVPPGTHRVRIEREALLEERAGQILSGVSLAMLAGSVLWRRRPRLPNRVF
jgi:hypothetical protein